MCFFKQPYYTEGLLHGFHSPFIFVQDIICHFWYVFLMLFLPEIFRAGNLTVTNLGAEAISDVTSSSGPVKLEDLQRILSSIGPAGI